MSENGRKYGIAFICFLIRVAAGCRLVTKHHDSPALLSAAISFSILVSGLPRRLWIRPQCVWWKLLFLCWELAWKVISFVGAFFFPFSFTKVQGVLREYLKKGATHWNTCGWGILNHSFVLSFVWLVVRSLGWSCVRSFVRQVVRSFGWSVGRSFVCLIVVFCHR